MPSWGDLEKPKAAEPKEDRFAELCARIFATPDGKTLLKELRATTIEAGTHPFCPEAVLRDLEGQRRLVRRIEAAAAKGLEMLASKNRPKKSDV